MPMKMKSYSKVFIASLKPFAFWYWEIQLSYTFIEFYMKGTLWRGTKFKASYVVMAWNIPSKNEFFIRPLGQDDLYIRIFSCVRFKYLTLFTCGTQVLKQRFQNQFYKENFFSINRIILIFTNRGHVSIRLPKRLAKPLIRQYFLETKTEKDKI